LPFTPANYRTGREQPGRDRGYHSTVRTLSEMQEGFPLNATPQPSQQAGVKPTIVLVHGAFADASSWNGVIERLQRQG